MTASPALPPAGPQSPARALIARLEAIAEQQDELHRHLIDALKTYAEASEDYLEAVERHVERTMRDRSSVIVEAAFLVAEHEDVDRRSFYAFPLRRARAREVMN